MDSVKLFRAIWFTGRALDGKRRKGKNPPPYLCHPFLVSVELLQIGCDEDTVIAGILHDVLEDGFPELPREEVRNRLREEFGDKILDLVDAVTEPKDPNMTKEEKERTWEARKAAYLEKLSSSSVEARTVACVDMWANLLEFRETLKQDGLGVLKFFNVDKIEKKFKHWREELEIFEKENVAHPYSQLVPGMKQLLEEIEELLCKLRQEK